MSAFPLAYLESALPWLLNTEFEIQNNFKTRTSSYSNTLGFLMHRGFYRLEWICKLVALPQAGISNLDTAEGWPPAVEV